METRSEEAELNKMFIRINYGSSPLEESTTHIHKHNIDYFGIIFTVNCEVTRDRWYRISKFESKLAAATNTQKISHSPGKHDPDVCEIYLSWLCKSGVYLAWIDKTWQKCLLSPAFDGALDLNIFCLEAFGVLIKLVYFTYKSSIKCTFCDRLRLNWIYCGLYSFAHPTVHYEISYIQSKLIKSRNNISK